MYIGATGASILQVLLFMGWVFILSIFRPEQVPALPPEEVTAVEVTRQGFRDGLLRNMEKRTDLRGRDYYWMGFSTKASQPAEGTDLRAIYEGRISVTPLHIDLTHHESVHKLKSVLGGAPPKSRKPFGVAE